jgi:hypothetical protein
LKKEALSFYGIKTEVAQLYSCDKTLHFLDSKGDKIMIHNQELIQYAIFQVI